MKQFSRRRLLSATAALACAAVLPQWLHCSGESKKPNVIVFYVDDMDPFEIGCYGGKVLTPNMDALAKGGVKFNRAYVVSSVCTPSRYNMLTGGYASRALNVLEKTAPGDWTRIGWNSEITQEVTLPQILQGAGYKTGMVGKWHNGVGELSKLKKDASPDDPEVRRIVAENYGKTVSAIKKAGFDFADALYAGNLPGIPLPKEWKVHNPEWMTDRALHFIESSKDKPFFLYFASTIPHAPYGTMEADPRITTAGLLDQAPQVHPSREDALRRAEAAGVEEKYRFLTCLDDGIGVIVQRLRDLKLDKNTLIIFMSDNGNPAKFTCYDKGARVPAMAYWPGRIKPGTESDAIVGNIDIPATLVDICGAKVPENAHLDGMSLRPLLEKGTLPARDGLMLEITCTRGIVNDRYKYIALRYPKEAREKLASGEWTKINQEGRNGSSHYETENRYPGYWDLDQLYDLVNDPNEQKNLAADPEYQSILDQMKQRLTHQSARLPMAFGEFKTGN